MARSRSTASTLAATSALKTRPTIASTADASHVFISAREGLGNLPYEYRHALPFNILELQKAL